MTHSQNFIFLSGVYELFPELSVSTIRRIIEPILSDESNKELIYRRNNDLSITPPLRLINRCCQKSHFCFQLIHCNRTC